MKDLESLSQQWLQFKEAERLATEQRRAIEDRLLSLLGVPETHVGTQEFGDAIKVKIVGRMNQKVDSDMLQEIAAESGLSDHLPNLFRWSAEVNQSQWKQCSESIRQALSAAITTKPGRPSFSISLNKGK